MNHLDGLLSYHHPAASGEAAHLQEVRKLLAQPGDPTDRSRFHPGHLTASAFVLHPRDAAVVLVHHAKLKLWVQPGGHFEPDDPGPEAAARREVAEEVGLTRLNGFGLCDVDVHRIPARGSQPAHFHFDLRFAFRAADEELIPGDGVLDASWVPLAEAVRMDESVARPARKLFEQQSSRAAEQQSSRAACISSGCCPGGWWSRRVTSGGAPAVTVSR